MNAAALPAMSATPLARQWRVSDWPNASLYCLIGRACHLDPSMAAGLTVNVPQSMRNRMVFAPFYFDDGRFASGIAAWLGDIGNVRARMAHGFPPKRQSAHEYDPMICRELRYCVQCAKLGYHSALFQHFGLAHCPKHNCALVVGCPKCLQPLQPSLSMVARDPFGCPKCGHLLISSLAAQAHGGSLKALDERIGELLAWLDPEQARDQLTAVPGNELPPGTEGSKVARRFAAWTGAHLWGAFPEEVIDGGSDSDSLAADLLRETAAGASLALKWTYRYCRERGHDVDQLARRLADSGGGVRLSGQASAVAVALCKTAFILRLDNALLRDLRSIDQWGFRTKLATFCRVTLERVTPRALDRLRELEVYGLFALCLIEAVQARRLSEICFASHPMPSRFVPAACLQKADDGSIRLRIRPRLEQQGMEHLVERFGAHQLVED